MIAGNLHAAGVPLTMVARGDHLQRIRTEGLRLDRVAGEVVVDAPVVASAAQVSWTSDTVVLLCVKSHQTAGVLDDLTAHAPEATPVVCAQNGIANERSVLRVFAATYGLCVMLPSAHLEPGVVVQKCHPVPGILDLGRYPVGVDEVAEQVAADLRAAGFESRPREDIMAWKHRKLLTNAVGDVSALFDGAEAEELRAQVRAEGEAVLAAAGLPVVSVEADDVRRGDVLRLRPDSPGVRGNSLAQSIIRGLPTEVDHRAGEIVLLGRLHGIPTPANDLVVRTVRSRQASVDR